MFSLKNQRCSSIGPTHPHGKCPVVAIPVFPMTPHPYQASCPFGHSHECHLHSPDSYLSLSAPKEMASGGQLC